MDDLELARCLELYGAEDCGGYRWIDAGVVDSLSVADFVRDWRVAGALIEERDAGLLKIDRWVRSRNWVVYDGELDDFGDESLPRSIILYCLSGK